MINMDLEMVFSFLSVDNSAQEVLDNIQEIISNLELTYPCGYYIYEHIKEVSIGNLKLIQTIKTKNDAILNMKHEDYLVRLHCKQILKGE